MYYDVLLLLVMTNNNDIASQDTPDLDRLLDVFNLRSPDLICSRDALSLEIQYHLRNGLSYDAICDRITTGDWMWLQSNTSDPIMARVDTLFRTPTSSGIIACICGSFNTNVDAKQTRSGDESMTVFVSCNDCGKKFKM